MYTTSYLVTQTVSQLITLGGVELSNSRRYADLSECEAIRWQYASSGSIEVRLEYSLDDGATWQALADEYGTSGSSPVVTAWQTIPESCKAEDVLLRAYAVGSGLLTSVQFVEVNFR